MTEYPLENSKQHVSYYLHYQNAVIFCILITNLAKYIEKKLIYLLLPDLRIFLIFQILYFDLLLLLLFYLFPTLVLMGGSLILISSAPGHCLF